jgi:hypothetical protein
MELNAKMNMTSHVNNIKNIIENKFLERDPTNNKNTNILGNIKSTGNIFTQNNKKSNVVVG